MRVNLMVWGVDQNETLVIYTETTGKNATRKKRICCKSNKSSFIVFFFNVLSTKNKTESPALRQIRPNIFFFLNGPNPKIRLNMIPCHYPLVSYIHNDLEVYSHWFCIPQSK